MKIMMHAALVCLGLGWMAIPAWATGQKDYRAEILPGLSEPSIGVALKINNSGQIAGWSNDTNGNPHAVLWERAPGGVYRVIDLGTFGGAYSWGYGLNDRGEVVGASTVDTGEEYAFVWSKGKMTNLGCFLSAPPLPHGWRTLSQANAINNAGQIVGWSVSDVANARAFLWQDGVLKDLGSLGPSGDQSSLARDINDRGEIAGWSITGIGESGAVRWHNGQMTKLDAEALDAIGINQSGLIAGMGGGPVDQGAFLWRAGVMSRSGVESSIAYGLNDSGQVVGSYLSTLDWNNGEFIYSAFLWCDGVFRALPSHPQAHSSYAYSINNQGQVAGCMVGQDWFFNPVIWTKAAPVGSKAEP